MEIFITEDYGQMSRKAAEIIAAQINSNSSSVIGFATGSTPVGTYKELIRMNSEGSLDFSGVTTFNLDEYFPIKGDDPQSYRQFMYENLFSHINVNKNNVNLLNGEAEDWEKEAAEYEEKIKRAGGIDLQILGIGNNGHIAFNEPAESFSRWTSLIKLTQDTINANARFFGKEEDVPKKALSMGIGSIMAAKKIIMLVSGKSKADAFSKAFYGDITPQVPASVLQFHQNVTLVADKEANF